MKTAKINGKEYQFMFNANTAELYYQVFKEDLTIITLNLKNKDSQEFIKNNRIQKLAYITNMQASKTIRELWGRIDFISYLEWANQFQGGDFITNSEVSQAIISGWTENIVTTSKIKNPQTPAQGHLT